MGTAALSLCISAQPALIMHTEPLIVLLLLSCGHPGELAALGQCWEHWPKRETLKSPRDATSSLMLGKILQFNVVLRGKEKSFFFSSTQRMQNNCISSQELSYLK